jgi:hypothetical protein
LADFQTTVLDNLAKVIGGSQPDAANRPRWFSGDQVGDSTGLLPGGSYPTFKGCYSAPVEAPQDFPVGIVLPGPFEVGGPQYRDVFYQGEEYNVDNVRLLIAITRIDLETDFGNLMPYRDLVPAAFAAKMTAFSIPSVLQAMVTSGKPAPINWAGVQYNGWDFTIRVIRMISQTYTP